jgi:hypothetical protein
MPEELSGPLPWYKSAPKKVGKAVAAEYLGGKIGKVIEFPLGIEDPIDQTICASILLNSYKIALNSNKVQVWYYQEDNPDLGEHTSADLEARVTFDFAPRPALVKILDWSGCTPLPPVGPVPGATVRWSLHSPLREHATMLLPESTTDVAGVAKSVLLVGTRDVPRNDRDLQVNEPSAIDASVENIIPLWNTLEWVVVNAKDLTGQVNPQQASIPMNLGHHEPRAVVVRYLFQTEVSSTHSSGEQLLGHGSGDPRSNYRSDFSRGARTGRWALTGELRLRPSATGVATSEGELELQWDPASHDNLDGISQTSRSVLVPHPEHPGFWTWGPWELWLTATVHTELTRTVPGRVKVHIEPYHKPDGTLEDAGEVRMKFTWVKHAISERHTDRTVTGPGGPPLGFLPHAVGTELMPDRNYFDPRTTWSGSNEPVQWCRISGFTAGEPGVYAQYKHTDPSGTRTTILQILDTPALRKPAWE